MTDDIIHVPGRWEIDYDHSAGETASRFLRAIGEDAQLLGKRCPECERVLMPPRGFCDRCLVDTDEWVEIGSEGHIESFTIVAEDIGTGPDPPFAPVYVQLKGADTAMVNLLEGVDLSDPDDAAAELAVGTPVRAVFDEADERESRITDFHWELAR
jgi:uncharacterized OB-fold protein